MCYLTEFTTLVSLIWIAFSIPFPLAVLIISMRKSRCNNALFAYSLFDLCSILLIGAPYLINSSIITLKSQNNEYVGILIYLQYVFSILSVIYIIGNLIVFIIYSVVIFSNLK